MSAIVIGSTGATGREVVKQLASSDHFETVFAISRREFDYKPENGAAKIKQLIVKDITSLDQDVKADHAFYCFGTTRGQAGSGEAFEKLELSTAENFIKLMAKSGVKHVGVVSSTGANESSFFLYPQVKGKIERMFREAAIENNMKLRIYRPGYLECKRENPRFAETLFAWVTPIGNWFCPQTFSIKTSDLAKAMVVDATSQKEEEQVIIRGNKAALQTLQGN